MKKRNLQLQIELRLYDLDVYKTIADAKAELSMSDAQMLYYALDADNNQFGEVCRFLVTDLLSQTGEEERDDSKQEEDSSH